MEVGDNLFSSFFLFVGMSRNYYKSLQGKDLHVLPISRTANTRKNWLYSWHMWELTYAFTVDQEERYANN